MVSPSSVAIHGRKGSADEKRHSDTRHVPWRLWNRPLRSSSGADNSWRTQKADCGRWSGKADCRWRTGQTVRYRRTSQADSRSPSRHAKSTGPACALCRSGFGGSASACAAGVPHGALRAQKALTDRGPIQLRYWSMLHWFVQEIGQADAALIPESVAAQSPTLTSTPLNMSLNSDFAETGGNCPQASPCRSSCSNVA
jgi:hypothetical protein